MWWAWFDSPGTERHGQISTIKWGHSSWGSYFYTVCQATVPISYIEGKTITLTLARKCGLTMRNNSKYLLLFMSNHVEQRWAVCLCLFPYGSTFSQKGTKTMAHLSVSGVINILILLQCLFMCVPVNTCGYHPTICARRYICAWLAVRVGVEFPRRTACWVMLTGVEVTPWPRLISWAAAAGELASLIWREVESKWKLKQWNYSSSQKSKIPII